MPGYEQSFYQYDSIKRMLSKYTFVILPKVICSNTKYKNLGSPHQDKSIIIDTINKLKYLKNNLKESLKISIIDIFHKNSEYFSIIL